MNEPSRRSSRIALAGAVLAAAGLLGGGFLLGQASRPAPSPPRPAPVSPAEPMPVQTPSLPEVQPAVGRAELIEAAARAADAFAAGRPAGDGANALAGRPFELKLPFACSGSSLEARHDTEGETLRIGVTPMTWEPTQWALGRPGQQPADVEAVQGFWIARPWTSNGACPPATAPAAGAAEAPAPAAEETLGIAQYFTAESSRVGWRIDRPFEAVTELVAAEPQPGGDLILRIRGRIAADANPIVCRAPAGPAARPVCLVRVKFDQLAVEKAGGGEPVATWDVAIQDEASQR